MIAKLLDIIEGTRIQLPNGKFAAFRADGIGQFSTKYVEVEPVEKYPGFWVTNEKRHGSMYIVHEGWLDFNIPTDCGEKIAITPRRKRMKVAPAGHVLPQSLLVASEKVIVDTYKSDRDESVVFQFPGLRAMLDFAGKLPVHIAKKEEIQETYANCVMKEFGIRVPEKVLLGIRDIIKGASFGEYAHIDFVKPTAPRTATGIWFRELADYRIGFTEAGALVMREFADEKSNKPIANTWLLPMNGWIVLINFAERKEIPMRDADILCTHLGNDYKMVRIEVGDFGAMCVCRKSDRGPMQGWTYDLPKEGVVECGYCGKRFKAANVVSHCGRTMCKSCARQHVKVCSCGKEVLDSTNRTTRGGYLCGTCEDKMVQCPDCAKYHNGPRQRCNKCRQVVMGRLRQYIADGDTVKAERAKAKVDA